jgi:hypothetical protein
MAPAAATSVVSNIWAGSVRQLALLGHQPVVQRLGAGEI